MLPGQVSKSALHTIASDGIADRLADHEADQGRIVAVGHQQVCDEGPRPRSPTRSDRGPEGRARRESMRLRQQVPVRSGSDALGQLGPVRQPGSCGPCGDARTGWRVRRGSACADGSRAPCGGDGCSADKYACSRALSDVGPSPCDLAKVYASTPAPSKMRVAAGLASVWPRSWTCGGTRRHRVTGQRYALRFDRVKPWDASAASLSHGTSDEPAEGGPSISGQRPGACG